MARMNRTSKTPNSLHKSIRVFLSITAALISLMFSPPAQAELREVPFISVMAASSLTVPLTELARLYSITSGITVNVTYDSSIELANQLEKGDRTDIFISSSLPPINILKKKELVDMRSISEIATNKLALIAANENGLAHSINMDISIRQMLLIISNRAMLIIGDPDATPLGLYTREMMLNLGLWDRIGPMTIRAETSRIALYLISQGKSLGITYYSDAVGSKETNIVAVIPPKFYSAIIYRAVAFEGKNKPFATQFIHFLTSPQAKEIFKRYGFGVKEKG